MQHTLGMQWSVIAVVNLRPLPEPLERQSEESEPLPQRLPLNKQSQQHRQHLRRQCRTRLLLQRRLRRQSRKQLLLLCHHLVKSAALQALGVVSAGTGPRRVAAATSIKVPPVATQRVTATPVATPRATPVARAVARAVQFGTGLQPACKESPV